MTPIKREDKTVQDSMNKFSNCIDSLIEKSSNRTNKDTTPLINNRRKIEDFKDGKSDSITFILQIKDGECNIECINAFIPDQIVKFKVSESETYSTDEASLREHRQEVIDFLNSFSPYRRRPQEKYRRTLCVSIKSEGQRKLVSIGVDEVRTRDYSVMERIISILGENFSSQSYYEFTE